MEKVGPRTLWGGPEDHWGLGRVHRTTPYEQATHLADNERDSEAKCLIQVLPARPQLCLSVCLYQLQSRQAWCVQSVGVVSE